MSATEQGSREPPVDAATAVLEHSPVPAAVGVLPGTGHDTEAKAARPQPQPQPQPQPSQRRPSRPRPRRATGSGRRLADEAWLGLVAILTVQALLSLRLVWRNTAFLDEATYLFGGHVEIQHWVHGTPVPAFATYFSGAPVIYPPLAALAASLGGVAAARLLSLAFMLGTTALLWSVTGRLFDRRAAFLSAALFAMLGPTQVLGAFATYDAMALFLLAASAWCVVAARDRDDSSLFLLGGALLLALANATKYATALFDPAVVALVMISAGKAGLKPALARGGYVAAVVLGVLSVLLALGGPWYVSGVLSTTLARIPGDKPMLLILKDAADWTGLIWVISLLGLVMSRRRMSRIQLITAAVLTAAGFLVPLDQARIHTTTSLFKQVDFGAWFAACAAGFALAQLSRLGGQRWLRIAVVALAGALTIAFAGISGRAQASRFFGEWPNSAQSTAALRSLVNKYPGNILAEDYNVPAYYLEGSIPWQRWSQTWYFSYQDPTAGKVRTGAAAFRAAIDAGYFSLVVLNFADTVQTDSSIVADMRQAHTYHLVGVVSTPYGLGSRQVMVWAYEPPAGVK